MRQLFLIYCLVCLLPLAVADPTDTPASPEPQPQASLPRMLELTWSAGPPMPQGMQDNHVSVIHNRIVSVGGFCGGYDDDWKPGKYPRGFLNKVWGLDLDREDKRWVEMPSYPGAPRQAMLGTRLQDALYLWGGFSYSEPYTYTDGFRLSRKDGEWRWDPLPPLPAPAAWAGVGAIDHKIYCLGGCDYDAENFYTLTDRSGKIDRAGARLLVLDTGNLEAGWIESTPCPGTPRGFPATGVVDGKLYFIGGFAVTPSGEYCNVVDSWRYDPATGVWERLRDLPISGSGTSAGLIVYQNRYILLPCGYQYAQYMKPDTTLAPAYGKASTINRTWENHPRLKDTHYYNHVFVYDTRTNLYGTATALPFDDVASITVILGYTAYLFPGETAGFRWNGEYFGHHPEFVLQGAIQELDWQQGIVGE
jgi:N-acetylneuraminic acid mutarotase